MTDLAFDQQMCPACGKIASADFVDIGVGMQQSGPFGCEACGWTEASLVGLFEMSDEDDDFAVPPPAADDEAKPSRGTFLGSKNAEGHEMHCANTFCPHQSKCAKGCINQVSRPLPPTAAEQRTEPGIISGEEMDEIERVAIGWRKMETAPKDGTKIDLIFEYPRGRTIDYAWRSGGVYGDGGWYWSKPVWGSQPGLNIDWHLLPESEWETCSYPNMQPLCWMPAPLTPKRAVTPPAADKRAGGNSMEEAAADNFGLTVDDLDEDDDECAVTPPNREKSEGDQ